MEQDLLSLRNLVSAICPLKEPEWEAFSAIWQPCAARRKVHLVSVGEKEKYLYFVLSGVQRVYYFDEQGREATVVFTYPPSFGGVLDAFLLQQSSRYYYETLTASTFLRTSYADLEKVTSAHPAIDQVIRQGVLQTFSGVLERLVELQCFSSEEKFRKLLSRSPHILRLVPHKYLANYLGIDPTNFSKLINKVRI